MPFLNSLTRCFNRSSHNSITDLSRRNKGTARNRFRNSLRVEQLEERALMAVVSSWSAENTAVDSVSGNNGTLMNGTSYLTGQIGKAFKFDGVDDRILVADSPSLALTHSLTIEVWIKANAISSSVRSDILFRGDSRSGFDPYELKIDPNGQLVFLIISDTNAASVVHAAIPVGQFVHVAATLDDATGAMSLYENGVLTFCTQP